MGASHKGLSARAEGLVASDQGGSQRVNAACNFEGSSCDIARIPLLSAMHQEHVSNQ